MLAALQILLRKARHPRHNKLSEEHIQAAVTVLLLETMKADLDAKPEERVKVVSRLADLFEVTVEEAEAIAQAAEADTRESFLLFPLARQLNEELTPEDKNNLIEVMWEVTYADGVVHRYEERLLKNVADILHISREDFVVAEKRAREKKASEERSEA